MTVVNAVLLAIVVAIVGAAVVPLYEQASGGAQSSALLKNLQTLRRQIELYKVQHGGSAPILHKGALPQLTRSTNEKGEPGPSGSMFPFGPYLRNGVPVNPITSRSIVTATWTFPPTEPSGNGGWLYHQETGQIAADLEEYLDE